MSQRSISIFNVELNPTTLVVLCTEGVEPHRNFDMNFVGVDADNRAYNLNGQSLSTGTHQTSLGLYHILHVFVQLRT